MRRAWRRGWMSDPDVELEVDWEAVWEARHPVDEDDSHGQDAYDDWAMSEPEGPSWR